MSLKNCRLCAGELFASPLIRLDDMPKAAQHFPEKSEFSTDRGIALPVRQCVACGLVQLDREPVDYFRDVITAATLSPKSRAARLVQMQAFSKKFDLTGKKILDIGTGKGELLDVLEEAGFTAAGIEASLASVEVGKAAGRKMVHGYIGEVETVMGTPFDAFVSLNYLEHMPEPGRVIRTLHALTSANAAGYVTVPNLDYLLSARCFYEFVADHLSYFTKKTLTYAFESNGFEVVSCETINNDNDIAVQVKKRSAIDLSGQSIGMENLIKDLQKLLAEHQAKNKKVAVWGAGHRTLALLSLAGIRDIAYVIDSAKFKQGRFTPVMHTKIVGPEHLREEPVDLVIVMVPGLYPGEVLDSLAKMNLDTQAAILRGEKIEFIS